MERVNGGALLLAPDSKRGTHGQQDVPRHPPVTIREGYGQPLQLLGEEQEDEQDMQVCWYSCHLSKGSGPLGPDNSIGDSVPARGLYRVSVALFAFAFLSHSVRRVS